MKSSHPSAVQVDRAATSTAERLSTPSLESSLEFDILLCCARTFMDGERSEQFRALLRNEPDWNRLPRLAGKHGLLPLLYWHLNAVAADLVPEKQLARLRGWFVLNAAEALECTGDLLGLLRLLEENGIFAVPYKGPPLAARLYGSVALRQRGDLDILIARRDVPRATGLLEEVGFRPRHPASQAGRDFVLRNRYSDIFIRENAVVELHWAFTSGEVAFPLDLSDIRPRLGQLSLGGSLVPAFGTEDLLLILCVHGAKHSWDRLEWLSGVSELLRKEPIAWPEALERASELRVEKAVLLGLLLAHDLLEAPTPPYLIDQARSNRDVNRLARFVCDRFLTMMSGEIEEPPQSLPRDLFRLRLQPSYRDRARYLFHRLTTPRREETRLMVPVGGRSIPLPAFVRPFRVVGKLVGSFFRSSSKRGPR